MQCNHWTCAAVDICLARDFASCCHSRLTSSRQNDSPLSRFAGFESRSHHENMRRYDLHAAVGVRSRYADIASNPKGGNISLLPCGIRCGFMQYMQFKPCQLRPRRHTVCHTRGKILLQKVASPRSRRKMSRPPGQQQTQWEGWRPVGVRPSVVPPG